jgi:hypothetical protein
MSPRITLRYLRLKYPERFHRQDWYMGEKFMDTSLPLDFQPMEPWKLRFESASVFSVSMLPMAVALAYSFIHYPDSLLWSHYLWCREKDQFGQRIYVGGVCLQNDFKFEIHRHLEITSKWGVIVWE